MHIRHFARLGFCCGLLAWTLGCSDGFLPLSLPQTLVQRMPLGVKGKSVLLLQMTFQDLPNLVLQAMTASPDESGFQPSSVQAVWLDLSSLQATPIALNPSTEDPYGFTALLGPGDQELSNDAWTVTAAWEGGPVHVVNNASGASADYLGDSRGTDYAPLLGLVNDRLVVGLPNERIAVIDLNAGTSSIIDGVKLDMMAYAFDGQFLAYREQTTVVTADAPSENPPTGDSAESVPPPTWPPPSAPIVLLDVTTGTQRTIATEVGYVSPIGLPQFGGLGPAQGFVFADGRLVWGEHTQTSFIARQYTLASDALTTLLEIPEQEGDTTMVMPTGLNGTGVLLQKTTTPFGPAGPSSPLDLLSMQESVAVVFQPFDGPAVPILDYTLSATDALLAGGMSGLALLIDDFVFAYDPSQGSFVVYQISTGQTQRTNPFGS